MSSEGIREWGDTPTFVWILNILVRQLSTGVNVIILVVSSPSGLVVALSAWVFHLLARHLSTGVNVIILVVLPTSGLVVSLSAWVFDLLARHLSTYVVQKKKLEVKLLKRKKGKGIIFMEYCL